jgi:hypothetical protein
MQAIALVTGDEFLLPFNLTIDISDVLNFIKSLTYDYQRKNYANFDDFYGIDFSLVFSPTGFCYTFNMVQAVELFHLDV